MTEKIKLEGEWYLFEVESLGDHLRSVAEVAEMKKMGLSLEGMIRKGWKATPVTVFLTPEK